MRAVGRAVWGIDASVLYASMGAIEDAAPGSTVVDVPCGGGVAFRALPFADGEVPPSREEVAGWLAASGLEAATIGPQPGFAAFSARKGPAVA